MERREGVTNIQTLTQRRSRLPTEIIYAIVAYLTGEYLDDVIAGPYALPTADMDAILAQHATAPHNADPPQHVGEQEDAAAAEALVLSLEFPSIDSDEDPVRDAPNPLLPLFRTSTQIRAITLLVLSDALGIRVIKEGIHR